MRERPAREHDAARAENETDGDDPAQAQRRRPWEPRAAPLEADEARRHAREPARRERPGICDAAEQRAYPIIEAGIRPTGGAVPPAPHAFSVVRHGSPPARRSQSE